MKANKFWIYLMIPVLVFGMIGLSACSDDDDDGDNNGSSAFSSDTQTPPSNSVYLELDSQDNNTITLAVKCKDLSNIYGIWFNLDFDGSVIQFISATEGNFLNDGASTSFFTTGKSYTVVVGASRMGNSSGKSGSGTICKLTFQGSSTGSSRFDFTANNAADPNGNTIGRIQWFGGTVTLVE